MITRTNWSLPAQRADSPARARRCLESALPVRGAGPWPRHPHRDAGCTNCTLHISSARGRWTESPGTPRGHKPIYSGAGPAPNNQATSPPGWACDEPPTVPSNTRSAGSIAVRPPALTGRTRRAGAMGRDGWQFNGGIEGRAAGGTPGSALSALHEVTVAVTPRHRMLPRLPIERFQRISSSSSRPDLPDTLIETLTLLSVTCRRCCIMSAIFPMAFSDTFTPFGRPPSSPDRPSGEDREAAGIRTPVAPNVIAPASGCRYGPLYIAAAIDALESSRAADALPAATAFPTQLRRAGILLRRFGTLFNRRARYSLATYRAGKTTADVSAYVRCLAATAAANTGARQTTVY